MNCGYLKKSTLRKNAFSTKIHEFYKQHMHIYVHSDEETAEMVHAKLLRVISG